jgi:hypothetical protein
MNGFANWLGNLLLVFATLRLSRHYGSKVAESGYTDATSSANIRLSTFPQAEPVSETR